MIAVEPKQMVEDFTKICDQVISGEIVVISRSNDENIIVLSEKEYDNIRKAAQNAAYLNKLDQSWQQIRNGKFISKTLEELEEYVK